MKGSVFFVKKSYFVVRCNRFGTDTNVRRFSDYDAASNFMKEDVRKTKIKHGKNVSTIFSENKAVLVQDRTDVVFWNIVCKEVNDGAAYALLEGNYDSTNIQIRFFYKFKAAQNCLAESYFKFCKKVPSWDIIGNELAENSAYVASWNRSDEFWNVAKIEKGDVL